jgi:hypothetical protein
VISNDITSATEHPSALNRRNLIVPRSGADSNRHTTGDSGDGQISQARSAGLPDRPLSQQQLAH